MKLKELLKKYSREAIFERLMEYHVGENSERGYHREQYTLLLDRLDTLEPKATDTKIVVKLVDYSYADEIEEQKYPEVFGLVKGTPEGEFKTDTECALDFTLWAEWLDMEIDQSSLDSFGELSILAYCLDEMTAYSFQEQEIIDMKAELHRRISDIDRWTKEGTINEHTISFKNSEEMLEHFKSRAIVSELQEDKTKDREHGQTGISGQIEGTGQQDKGS